jgi:Ca2+-binding EF-hand superfamily protein
MVDTSRYEATFNIVDADGDGLIDTDELQGVMRALGEEITAERATEVLTAVDRDGDGRISLEEFSIFMEQGAGNGAGAGT